MPSKHDAKTVDRIIAAIKALSHPTAADLARIMAALEAKAAEGGPAPNAGGGPGEGGTGP